MSDDSSSTTKREPRPSINGADAQCLSGWTAFSSRRRRRALVDSESLPFSPPPPPSPAAPIPGSSGAIGRGIRLASESPATSRFPISVAS
ncbi:hypothetical protein VTJ04DRAFT_4913 [Mycothermus thermophilus]|uniref:uncharacterized protein n=1 Tax=Humicola insolens TaxID=85995 RepID=UPI00374219BE